MSQPIIFGAPRGETDTPSPSAGAVFTRIDEALDALLSNNYGASAPVYAVEGSVWAEEAAADSVVINLRVGGAWYGLFDIDPVGGGVSIPLLSAAAMLEKLLTVDGDGSGIDADTVDGVSFTDFVRSSSSDFVSGDVYTMPGAAAEVVRIGTGDGDFNSFVSLYTDLTRRSYWQGAGSIMRFNRAEGGRVDVAGAGVMRHNGGDRFLCEDYTATAVLTATAKLQSEFISGAIPVVSATQSVMNHGLGVLPSIVSVEAVCITAEDGYSVGDVVLLTVGDINGGSRGWSIRVTDTQILLRFGASSINITQINPDTGAAVNFVNDNWELYVRAYQ